MLPRKQRVCRVVLLTVLTTTTLLTFLTFDPGGGGGGDSGEAPVEGPGWVKNIHVKNILTPKKCVDESEVVVIVHSHANNTELRSSQRKAAKINGKNQNLKFVFVLFLSEDGESDGRVHQEHREHGDILLGDLAESYHHLIYKHTTALRWVTLNCPDNLLVKMDDDIYVNFPSLLSLVPRNIPPSAGSRWMMGLLQLSLPVLRNNTSKWAVSTEDWSQDLYPDFLSGWCYISPPTSVRLIVEMLDSQQNIFWIDDLMITGVVAPSVGIRLASLNSYFTMFSSELECCRGRERTERCSWLVGPTDSQTSLLTSLAERDSYCSLQPCSAPTSVPSCTSHRGRGRGEVLPI